MKLPKTISEDGIQRRTAERIADIPVPQVVEGLVKVSKVSSQDRVQQRFGGQIVRTLGISLAEKIVEMTVTQVLEHPDEACKMALPSRGSLTLFVEKTVVIPEIQTV